MTLPWEFWSPRTTWRMWAAVMSLGETTLSSPRARAMPA